MAEPWLGTTSGGENRPRPLRTLAGWPLRLAALFFASRIEALGLRRIPDRGPAVLLVSGETSAVSLLLTLAILRRPARFAARLRQSRGRLRSSLVRALGGIPLGVGADPGVRARNEEGLRTLEHELVSGGLAVLFVGRGGGEEGHAETALEAIRRASGRGSAPRPRSRPSRAWAFLLANLALAPLCYALLAWALFSWGGISAALAGLALAPMAGLWLVEAPGFLRRRLAACLFLARCPVRGGGASVLSALRSEVGRALAALPDLYRE
ncbi:MAG: hypothetical protein ACP5VF_06255 [Acidobacteriota bacterium]